MNLTATDAKPFITILFLILSITILDVCSYAYYARTTYNNDTLTDYFSKADISMRRVCDYLTNNGWVDERVDKEELDYTVQLAIHISSYYDNVTPALTIATIAQESKFYKDDEYEGALGLMQLLPSYHSDRLIQCLEKDERYSRKLFYDPRLNIMTGLDYLSQLINECNGDIPYALMCYNQGPSSAYVTYIKHGIISNYAERIMKLSEELDELLPGS